MKRSVSAMLLAAAVSGCMSSNTNPSVSNEPVVRASGNNVPTNVPGFTGPWGEPIPMQAPYTASPPMNAYQAKNMVAQSVPLNWMQMGGGVQQAGAQMPGGMMMPPGGMLAPPGVPFSPALMPPGGMMPGGKGGMPMGMPGGKGMPPGMVMPASAMSPPGAVAAVGAMTGQGQMPPGYTIGRTQVRFSGPESMRIAWLTQGADCKPAYSGTVVEAPGRYNFNQASIYRLKLAGIRGRPGLEVYPTLEVVPSNPKTGAFLAHSAVPVEFTPEDFQEVTEGKYLVKVIYLPDPQYQEIAATGTDQIISTRLEPGADPILEAQRRGCILLVIRMGNVDQEAPNTPPLDCTSPAQSPMGAGAPGLMPAPSIPAPSIPAVPPPGSSMPPALRPNPSSPAPTVSPMPTPPGLPGGAAPSPGPALGGALSKASDSSTLRPASAMPMLPDSLPLPTASTMPPMPPMPSLPTAMPPVSDASQKR